MGRDDDAVEGSPDLDELTAKLIELSDDLVEAAGKAEREARRIRERLDKR